MVNGPTLSQQKYLTVIKISIILWQSKLMCSIDLHIVQSKLLKIILDSKFYMVIYEDKQTCFGGVLNVPYVC